MEFYTVLYFIFLVSFHAYTLEAEPVCSKFDYEIKTLEAMLRTEQKVEKMVEDMKTIRETVLNELGEIKAFKTQLLEDYKTFKKTVEGETNKSLKFVSDTLEENKSKQKDLVVAFSVGKPSGSIVNGVPIFTQTITNIGDGYNMATGIFTSPIDGLYSFVFIVASNGQTDVYCWIIHNESKVSFGRSYSDNSHTTAAASVFLVLSKGDQVKLGGCGGWSNVYSPNGDTTFSGALFKQTGSKN